MKFPKATCRDAIFIIYVKLFPLISPIAACLHNLQSLFLFLSVYHLNSLGRCHIELQDLLGLEVDEDLEHIRLIVDGVKFKL